MADEDDRSVFKMLGVRAHQIGAAHSAAVAEDVLALRSAGTLAAILEEARAKSIHTIVSFHDFNETPSRSRLDEIARMAQSLGADLLKVATRTDTSAQLSRLRDFFLRERLGMKIAAMGVGRLGRIARIEFAKCGSVLNYAHLGNSQAEGQLSITQLRRILP